MKSSSYPTHGNAVVGRVRGTVTAGCVLTLIALGGLRVMASSNYKCVDTSWSIHNQTWMLTQWILRHVADNEILIDKNIFLVLETQ